MLIYFLRHGLTEYNAEKRYQGQRDIPLSAAGRAMCILLPFAAPGRPLRCCFPLQSWWWWTA